jgi:signal transduction histidine kinase
MFKNGSLNIRADSSINSNKIQIVMQLNTKGKERSLTKEFALFVSIIIITVFLLTIMSSWYSYAEHKANVRERLEMAASRVERSFTYSLDYSEYILNFILLQMDGHWSNLAYIDNVLSTLKIDRELNTILSWNMLYWANEYHRLMVNSQRHILPKSIDVSTMSNMPATMTEPKIMHLGNPIIGASKRQRVIPATMGAIDAEGRYVGAVGIGFDVEGVVNKLKDVIDMDYIDFTIIDQNFLPVIQPSHNSANFYRLIEKFHKMDARDKTSGVLSEFSFIKQSNDAIFHTIARSPYTLLLSYDKNIAEQEIWKDIFIKFLQFMLVASIISVLLYGLYIRIIHPISQLSLAVDNLSEGKRNMLIPISNHYEINNLGEKLQQVEKYISTIEEVNNKLVVQSTELLATQNNAEVSKQEIREMNEHLEKKITERTQALEAILQSKDKFLNYISHEMRTPIHGVMNFSDILVEQWDDIEDSQRRLLAARIHNSSDRLFQLVTNILDVSKFKAGKMTMTFEEADLAEATRPILEDSLGLYMNKKDITLILEEPKIPTKAVFDKERIMQLIRNLVANAIKYTDSGTITARITKVLYEQDNKMVPGLQFSLQDEGKGIPESELNDIFNPFVQSSHTKSNVGSTGLGLSISKEIIDAHQGKIWVHNNASGVGVTFYFIIPLSR